MKSIKNIERELAPAIKALMRKNKNLLGALTVVAGFGLIGTFMIVASQAATYSVQKEAEDGTTAGNFESVSDTLASGGRYIKFGGGGGTTPPPAGGDPDRADWNCGGSFSGDVGGTIQPKPAGNVINAGGDPSSAISSAGPGDVVVIPPGEYGSLDIDGQGEANNCITIMGDGGIASFSGVKVNGSYLRIMNISSKGSGSYGWSVDGNNHITLANVKVEGSQNGGIQFAEASFILIDGCDVDHTNGGPGNSGEGEAISVADSSTNSEVRYCKVHDSGEEGIDVKYSNEMAGGTQVKVHHNEVFGNGGPNIYIDGVNGVKVYNNKVYGATKDSKSGIMLGCESNWVHAGGGSSRDIEIFNNEIHDNAAAGISVFDGGCGINDIYVHDNTLSGGDDLDLGGATGVREENNTIN